MTQEEKQLLLKEVCARLPYGVKINIEYYDLQGNGELKNRNIVLSQNNIGYCFQNSHWVSFKPYLRSMSSMTQEEIDEYDSELDKDLNMVMNGALDKDRHITSDGKHNFSKNFVEHFGNDWLNSRHFDYRGLIEKGLALEAPEGMYKAE